MGIGGLREIGYELWSERAVWRCFQLSLVAGSSGELKAESRELIADS